MQIISLTELKNKNFIISSINYHEVYPYDAVEDYLWTDTKSRLHLSLSGNAQIRTLNGSTINLRPQSLMYVPADSRFLFSEDNKYSYLDIYFEIIDFETKEKILLSDEPKLLFQTIPTEIFDTLMSFSNLSKFSPRNPHLLQLSIIYRILYLISRNEELKSEQHSDYSKIAESIKYMEDNVRNTLSCKDFANMCGFSETHFRRLFKKYMKTTPMHYNNVAKINWACHHLKTTNNSIVNISNYLGFASVSDFCRVFKKIKGISATEYRMKK